MQKMIILHTNDIHGHTEQLTRIATLVEQIRNQSAEAFVLYVDAGDIEESSVRLSNLTKGAAMYSLLGASGCEIATIGNGGLLRYGASVLPTYAQAASYPLLLANVEQPDGTLLPGVQASILWYPTSSATTGTKQAQPLSAQDEATNKAVTDQAFVLGVIGVTSDIDGAYDSYGYHFPPLIPLIRKQAEELRKNGAKAVVLLSHLGFPVDISIAADLQQDIELIIGAHSHHLLAEGKQIGEVWIAQAGEYGKHLGRVDLEWDGEQLRVCSIQTIPITHDIEQSPRLLKEIHRLEGETEHFLQDQIGELIDPLDYAAEQECGTVNLMADMLRAYMQAEVALITPGIAFSGPLPAGRLTRLVLWDVCSSAANPGVVTMSGAQFIEIIKKGLDPLFAQERPRPMRGLKRGLMHISGAYIHNGELLIGDQPVELDKTYRVAGSDWELSFYGSYTQADWNLQPEFDSSMILREALEIYLQQYSPIKVEMGRITSPIRS